MKILMINSVCGIRSTGRIATDLAVCLEREGHDCKIAFGRFDVPTPYKKYAVRMGTKLEVWLHALNARLFDACGFGSRWATKRLISWIRAYEPDIIHLHNLHGYYLHIGLLFQYLKTCGKPVIWTLHDCWAFTGHSAYCDAIACEKWKTGCGDCPQKNAYPKSFLDRSARNWQRKREIFCGVPNLTLVTPSHWLAGLTRQSFLKEYPVQVIHNGIDTTVFRPAESDFRQFYHLEDAFLVLGAASTWNSYKGLQDCLQLAKQLGPDAKVVLVGLDAAQRRALPENILGLEPTASPKELAQIYAASDVFINLTYCDTYPTVNLEAVSCGIPVITYETGGSPETVQNQMGYVCPKGDVQAVAEVIHNMMQKRQSIKKQASSSSRPLDKEEAAMKYRALYCDQNSHGGGGTDLS